MKNCDAYLKQTERILDNVYSKGYSDGFEKAKEKYGQHSRGTAHIKRATNEEVKRHGIELFGWCDCGKPIEGRWVHMANFCPWCGKVMERDK